MVGNPSDGYTMVINPGSHGSGASIQFSYWATAGTLASGSDVSMCPDPNYLVERAAAYLWEAADDGRFQVALNESDRVLARMLEFENAKGYSYDDRVQTYEESKYGWRIGRD